MGVPYAARPLPIFEASHEAIKKWKAEVSKNPAAKKVKSGPNRATPSKMAPPLPKTGPAKKIGVLKITRPKAQPGP
jgi:outer membrane PBP1 activator LpoA protein